MSVCVEYVPKQSSETVLLTERWPINTMGMGFRRIHFSPINQAATLTQPFHHTDHTASSDKAETKKKKKPLYSTQYSDSIFLHLIFHELQSSDLKGSSPYASESTLFSFFLSEDSPGAVQSGIQVPTTYNMLWG